MEKSSKENLVNDIENRLDDFFSDGETPPPPSNEASPPSNEAPSPSNETPSPSTGAPRPSLEKLKSLVLSIDWEITDACLTDLIAETDVLLPRYEKDRITHALFRMLRAVGRYIRKQKAQAHPDAIKRVMSAFASIETLVQNQQLDEDVKKRIVAKEITAFKKLKEQVEVKRNATKKAANHDTKAVPGFVDQHKFEQAMKAVEERVNSQVAALKTQITNLQNELDTLRNT